MENRIDSLFKYKQGTVLSIYFTAGYPNLNDTLTIAKELEANGVDMLEIGIPFSDPLADGPVIQNSSKIAIQNGMCIELLLEQLITLRKHISIPVLLMGYYNPMLQYGVVSFLEKIAAIGIDGLIIPDMPIEEYQEIYEADFKRLNLKNILLITPQNSDSRIRYIDSVSGGFIYVVSSSATTGGHTDFSEKREAYLSKISSMKLNNPCVVGFGIQNKEDVKQVGKYADGTIIGTAFINAIAQGELKQQIKNFIKTVSHDTTVRT